MQADKLRELREVLELCDRIGMGVTVSREQFRDLLAIAEAAEDLRADAMRWRAVIGSARVRVLGSAGLRSELNPYGKPWNGYAHIGLELWTKHEAAPHEPTDAVEWVTKYADIAALSTVAPVREGT